MYENMCSLSNIYNEPMLYIYNSEIHTTHSEPATRKVYNAIPCVFKQLFNTPTFNNQAARLAYAADIKPRVLPHTHKDP